LNTHAVVYSAVLINIYKSRTLGPENFRLFSFGPISGMGLMLQHQ